MSIIKIILITGLISLVVYFMSNADTYRVNVTKKLLGLFFVLFAIMSVLFPNLTDDVARPLGIGRGADLLLYLLVIAFLFTVLNVYINNRKSNEQITKLARKISILETKLETKSNNKKTRI